MRDILSSVSAVLVGAGLLLAGNGLLGTLIGVRLSMGGSSPLAIGLVMAAYFAGLLVGALTAHRVMHRAGHIRAFATFASSLSAATLAHAFLTHEIFWGALRFIEGLCLASLFMCMESWLNDRAPNNKRGQVLSVYMTVVYCALGLGQFLILVAAPDGFGLFALASILLSLALVPVALTRYPAPPPPEPTAFKLGTLIQISPLGVAGSFAAGIILGAVYGLVPSFTHEIGMDLRGTANFMAAILLGGLLLQWPIGRLSDRFDRRLVLLAVALAIAGTGAAMHSMMGREETEILLLGVAFGGAIYLIYPLSISHANDFVAPGDLVAAAGGLLIAYSVGAIMGPILGALAMIEAGPGGLFILIALVGGMYGLFACLRILRARPRNHETAAPFQAVPRTSPVAARLDPRTEPEEAADFAAPAPTDQPLRARRRAALV